MRILYFPFGLLLLPGFSYAHETWFYPAEDFSTRWGSAFAPPNVHFVGGALLVTLVGWALWRWRGRRSLLPSPARFGASDERYSAVYGLIPTILGVHIAVPLLVSGVKAELFSPNNDLSGAWAYLLGLLQVGVALSFFYGGFTPDIPQVPLSFQE